MAVAVTSVHLAFASNSNFITNGCTGAAWSLARLVDSTEVGGRQAFDLHPPPGDPWPLCSKMHLRSFTYDELVSNGVNQSFARVLTDPEAYHPDLKFHIGETNWDYFVPEGVSEVVPLWDDNADSYVRWIRDGRREYVHLYHDDPNWTLIAKSEQGIMAKLWQGWVEFQDTDEDCQRFADAIGFRHCQAGLRILQQETDSETIDRWRLSLTDD